MVRKVINVYTHKYSGREHEGGTWLPITEALLAMTPTDRVPDTPKKTLNRNKVRVKEIPLSAQNGYVM